jgi:hypothetical protein
VDRLLGQLDAEIEASGLGVRSAALQRLVDDGSELDGLGAQGEAVAPDAGEVEQIVTRRSRCAEWRSMVA